MTDDAYEHDDEFDNLLDQIADQHELDPDFIRELIDYESLRVHLDKRRGAKEQIRRMIEDSIERAGS